MTALKFSDLFDRLYERLESHPEGGAPRPDLGRHIRIGVVTPYLVIYRYAAENDTVTVLRLLDGRRRISGKLLRAG